MEELRSVSQSLGISLDDPKFASEMDSRDPLKEFRGKFHIPKAITIAHDAPDASVVEGSDCLYFTGNSLGLQPKSTRKYIEEELLEWEQRGVEGHFRHSKERHWLNTDEFVIKQSCNLVGAQPEEVAIMNSLSVNLHLMMVPFYRPTKERFKILIEAQSFPSDLYAAQSQLNFHGLNPETALIQLHRKEGQPNLSTEDIISVIEKEGHSIALILLPGIQYYTGQFFEIEKIVKAGHAQGCIVGFDLAHAVGNVPLKLHDWEVDFACWCSYKYLNSGPGGIAGCFVHSKHATTDRPRFAGWWGHDLSTRFTMTIPEFHPIPGAFGYRLSNPPVLCVAPLLASLEIFEEAGLENLRKKSILLTCYLEYLVKLKLSKFNVTILTPEDVNQRGCQLSLEMSRDVTEIEKKLEKRGIICDVRKPSVLRVSPTPLYNTFSDVFAFVNIIETIL
eukprot:TRINITY_DN10630_c0_g1_i1.p1 TRINITY_DN10630_c0_g1~~TRINITY_DN10630_c0_g1_i1.p1  ORF type:complete len:447 (-),score=135.27 TRINITY_DN10630_c0_g1_i1:16-1356(-)